MVNSQRIDFTALPLDEATLLLQTVGLELLRQALLGKAAGERPRLASLLPSDEARRLAPRPNPFRLLAPSYRVTLTRAVGPGLSEGAWRSQVWGQLRDRLGRGTLRYVPDALWPVVAERAWGSPQFQQEAALLARQILQTQYLFPPGELPRPIFATGTFWALLLLAQTPYLPAFRPQLGQLFSPSVLRSPSRFGRHLGGIGRALWDRIPPATWAWLPTAAACRQRAARHLGRRAATELLAAEGWAGFWDQHVMTRAILLWHDGEPDLPAHVRTALLALPVVHEAMRHVSSHRRHVRRHPRRAAGTTASAQATPIPVLADPGWEALRPRWLVGQYDPLELVGDF
jgi:hypothetical protein